MADVPTGLLGRIVDGDRRGRCIEAVGDGAKHGGWLIFTYADVDRSDAVLEGWAMARDEDFDAHFVGRTVEWFAPGGDSARERSLDAEVFGVARAWIEYQRASDEGGPDHADPWLWGGMRIDSLLHAGDIDRAWLVILGICAQVEVDDLDLALMIGAGPLEDFIVKFGDKAMDLIEPALQGNETLLKALAGVWDRGSVLMRIRIDGALSAHGQERL